MSATRHTLTEAEDPIQYCYDRGWTDGLPVVPPTEERVAAMLAGRTLPRNRSSPGFLRCGRMRRSRRSPPTA